MNALHSYLEGLVLGVSRGKLYLVISARKCGFSEVQKFQTPHKFVYLPRIMGKQKAYRPTRREPNQNARCSEAQRLLAKYISLKKITAKELDLMRKMLQEERVRIVINGSGLSEEQSEIGLATSSVAPATPVPRTIDGATRRATSHTEDMVLVPIPRRLLLLHSSESSQAARLIQILAEELLILQQEKEKEVIRKVLERRDDITRILHRLVNLERIVLGTAG
ncbi:hypothetical protein TWF706_009833 [Orbilia oligospora]|nr:hypothetical protein TWF706_009833 [Orbilia oligospora]